MKRIGIYGGTFSPPHLGHVHAAKKFKEALSLDMLYIIPTFIPPHKQRTEATSPEDRLAMCRLAFSEKEGFLVSDLEIKRQGKSYTSDTLRALTEPNVRLFFLCGTDMFLTMEEWHEPEVIFELADIVCVSRENSAEAKTEIEEHAETYRQKYGANIHLLGVDAVELSSSEIRNDRAKGKDWRHKVLPTVAEYIETKGLYL